MNQQQMSYQEKRTAYLASLPLLRPDEVKECLQQTLGELYPSRFYIDATGVEDPTVPYHFDPMELAITFGRLFVWVNLRELVLLRLRANEDRMTLAIVPTNPVANDPDVRRDVSYLQRQEKLPYSVKRDEKLTEIGFSGPPFCNLPEGESHESGIDCFREELRTTLDRIEEYVRKFP